MLIGDVLYYTRSGHRLNAMDTAVSLGYAIHASKGRKDVVQWTCSNGDPKDIRYYSEGCEIDAATVERWARLRELAK